MSPIHHTSQTRLSSSRGSSSLSTITRSAETYSFHFNMLLETDIMLQSKTAEYDLYSNPTTGILSRLPRAWVPYAELIRFHKPAGILFIHLPYLLGNLFAASIKENPPLPGDMLRMNLVLFGVAFVVRSVGCTWNDIVDREVDKYISRSSV